MTASAQAGGPITKASYQTGYNAASATAQQQQQNSGKSGKLIVSRLNWNEIES